MPHGFRSPDNFSEIDPIMSTGPQEAVTTRFRHADRPPGVRAGTTFRLAGLFRRTMVLEWRMPLF